MEDLREKITFNCMRVSLYCIKLREKVLENLNEEASFRENVIAQDFEAHKKKIIFLASGKRFESADEWACTIENGRDIKPEDVCQIWQRHIGMEMTRMEDKTSTLNIKGDFTSLDIMEELLGQEALSSALDALFAEVPLNDIIAE